MGIAEALRISLRAARAERPACSGTAATIAGVERNASVEVPSHLRTGSAARRPVARYRRPAADRVMVARLAAA